MTEKSETAIATSELKVIGTSFGRTGTRSMKMALEALGFAPCYHMAEAMSNPKHMRLWEAAVRGETVNWREIFQGYQATVAWPACSFYKELMLTYPDAKIILTVRDPESWYQSAQNTIYQASGKPPSAFTHLLLRLFLPDALRGSQMVNTLVWQGTFQGRFEDKQYAIEVFNQHVEEVKKYVPPEQLLIYNLKEGWGPLCTFLGVEVPDKPFPHLNPGVNFLERRAQRLRKAIVRKALISAGLMIIPSFILLILFRLRKTIKRGCTSGIDSTKE